MTPVPGKTWPAAFEPIRRDFGFSLERDQEAARWLARALSRAPYDPPRVLDQARAQVAGRTVWVLGAADTAGADVMAVPPGDILWTADGATLAAHQAGRVPHAIVTDLDGHPPAEALMSRYGALVFVHAHGDNVPALEEHLPRFPPERVAGTCQVEPLAPLINPGGFTDGDRAVHLALAVGAAEVRLVGFDFERPGAYSGKPRDAVTKKRKLAWARRLVDDLIADGANVRLERAAAFRR